MMILTLWNLSFASNLKDIGSNNWLGEILTTKNTDIITPPDDHAMMKWTHNAIQSEGNHTITNISNTETPIYEQSEAEELTLAYINRLINWALWMLAFVALLVVIYGWFQMVTAAGDDAKYKSWKTALKKASIGIIWIGISWLFVSFIFWLVELIS